MRTRYACPKARAGSSAGKKPWRICTKAAWPNASAVTALRRREPPTGGHQVQHLVGIGDDSVHLPSVRMRVGPDRGCGWSWVTTAASWCRERPPMRFEQVRRTSASTVPVGAAVGSSPSTQRGVAGRSAPGHRDALFYWHPTGFAGRYIDRSDRAPEVTAARDRQLCAATHHRAQPPRTSPPRHDQRFDRAVRSIRGQVMGAEKMKAQLRGGRRVRSRRLAP